MKITEKKLSIRSIILVTFILPVAVIIISSVAIYITARSVQPQETFDLSYFSDVTPVVSAEISDKNEAASLFDKLINDAVSSGIIRYTKTVPVNIDSIECDNKNVQDIFNFAASSFSGKLSSMYEGASVKYGEDASAVTDVLPGSVPSEFSVETDENDNFTLTLSYTSVFSNMYFIGEDTAAVTLFTTENSGVFSVINKKFIPEKCVYTLKGNSITGEISSLRVARTYMFSANISFVNTLSAIGATPLAMKLTFSDNFDFSYAGIKIEEDIMTLDKNGYDTLTVTPFTEDGLGEDEYSLEFISSDPSVATVDENGQVEAVAESESPVEISVVLKYLGRSFTDKCTVYVVTPTERVTVSDSEISLAKGEKYTLSAEVKPDDATIKDVMFISSDESIVTVSENGEVVAVSEGTATVSAVTSQGLLAAGCVVTVTE